MRVKSESPPFYGRKPSLRKLTGHLRDVSETGNGQMLSARGRRQVGKSRLFTKFVESSKTPYVYFTGIKKADTPSHLQQLRSDVFESTTPLADAENLFASTPIPWTDALQRVALCARAGPTIVVLDEFPCAGESDPSLESALQNVWDRQLEHLPILLVLIGSDLTVMERLAQHDRPLFGRTKEFVVRPFDVKECAEASGANTLPMTAFDTLLITGGYPRLVAACARSASPDQFVIDQLTDENNDLLVVGQRVLDAEFPDSEQTRRVLEAIGYVEKGAACFSRVVGKISTVPSSSQETALSRALKILVDIKHVVAVDTPIGSGTTTRLRRYRIEDSYLRFWLRFIAPQLANIARGRSDLATAAFRQDWKTWRGRAIEPIVWKAVFTLAGGDERFGITEQVGAWWNRDNSHEFDVVAADRKATNVSVIGSVKWRETRIYTI